MATRRSLRMPLTLALLLLAQALLGCSTGPAGERPATPEPAQPVAAQPVAAQPVAAQPDRPPADPPPAPPTPAAPEPGEPPGQPVPATPPAEPSGPAGALLPPGCHPGGPVPRPPYGVVHTASRGHRVQSGTCRVVVDTGNLNLTFALPRALDQETVLAALSHSAPAAPRTEFWPAQEHVDGHQLQVYFPAGEPGEVLTVRLQGPLGPDGAAANLGFELVRHPNPMVQLALQQPDGTWLPVAPGATLPSGPLTLQFSLTGGLSAAQVREQIRHSLAGTAARFEQPAPDRILVTLPVPPPRIWLTLDGVTGEHDLRVQPDFLLFYTGEPPRLVRLNPATGQERPVGEVPVSVFNASASPDGRWAALVAAPPYGWGMGDIWLVNTETGRLYQPPFVHDYHGFSPIWLPDRVLLPGRGVMQVWYLDTAEPELQESRATYWREVSPDGRYLLGHAVDMSREDPATWLAPATVVVYDLETGTERAFADVATGLVPHSDSPLRLGLWWGPDSSTALIESYVRSFPGQAPPETEWLQLDLTTGRTSPYQGPRPTEPPPAEWQEGPGGWAYKAWRSWGGIQVRSPQGEEQILGEGMALGWTNGGELLVIRWPNHPYAMGPMGL